MAVVEVGQMGDLEPMERWHQPSQYERDAIQFEPGRFDVPGVANPGPRAADRPCDPNLERWSMRHRVSVVCRTGGFTTLPRIPTRSILERLSCSGSPIQPPNGGAIN